MARRDASRRTLRRARWLAGALALLLIAPTVAVGAGATPSAIDNRFGVPDVRRVLPTATDGEGVSATLAIVVLLTILSVAPAILVMTTSFTRMIVVLSLLRQAIGTQQLPPSQVIVGFSLLLTMLVMAPTWRTIQKEALEPYLAGRMSQEAAFTKATQPLREFMIHQIEGARNEEHVYLFVEYTRGASTTADAEMRWSDVGLSELIPAFVLSELKVAFIMGVRLYLPFLVIDLVVASVLISMGMMMLPPVLISLPFKLMLFVLADGWRLVVGSLLASFGG